MHATMTDRARAVSPCQAEFRASLLHFGHRQINYHLNSQLQISLDRCPGNRICRIAPRAGWEPQPILSDQRFRLALGLVLTTAWASVAIALIRKALQPGVVPLLAT